MQYVICYDLADDRRRDRLAATLLNYGQRVEESVFVANLDMELAAKMLEGVKRVIDDNFDRVHVFELCGSCAARTVTMGTGETPRDRAFYIV